MTSFRFEKAPTPSTSSKYCFRETMPKVDSKDNSENCKYTLLILQSLYCSKAIKIQIGVDLAGLCIDSMKYCVYTNVLFIYLFSQLLQILKLNSLLQFWVLFFFLWKIHNNLWENKLGFTPMVVPRWQKYSKN